MQLYYFICEIMYTVWFNNSLTIMFKDQFLFSVVSVYF